MTDPLTPDGLYVRDIRKAKRPLLTAEEEVELAARIAQGDEEARHTLVESNLRLVLKIAKRFQGRGLPYADCVQEGNLGLFKAAEKFDGTLGFRFSTYANNWIRQYIEMAIGQQGPTVRLPRQLLEQLGRLDRAAKRFHQTTGRAPTDEELAAAAGVDLEVVRRRLRYRYLADTLSLDAEPPAREGEGGTLHQFLPSDVSDPGDRIDRLRASGVIRAALSLLPDRQREIVVRRFGLDGEAPENLRQIGEKMGVCRERIRQIQVEAFGVLREALLPEFGE